MSKVLRKFDYSFDGVTALTALVGDDIDFKEMTAGLVAEKYIEPTEAPAKLESAEAEVVVTTTEEADEVADVVADVIADEVPAEAEPENIGNPQPTEAPAKRKGRK